MSKAQSLALYRAAIKGTLDPMACLMGSYDESKSYCGAIQYYIIMVATAVVIPILCGLFTVLFYCCRACPCCKFKVCCYNCGGKQPRNRLTPEGQWVSGPYTKCEKSFWYSAHALVLAVLLLLSIGGGFSVSAIPDNIAIIFDAVIYVIEIPGKFFDQVASPAILVAITSMRAEVTDINSNYTAAASAVKSAAAALATACASGCCSSDQSKYAALRDLDALTKTFEPNAFTGFLNNTLNQKLIEGKDMVKKLNVPTDTVKSVKDFPKMIPAGTGFVLFAPVFLPILINLLAFLCKKQCPFWCSHRCAFLFSGLVFLIFIVIFLVGSVLSEMCLFLPAATVDSVDASGIDAIFPPSADKTPSDITTLFTQCLAKKKGGNMFRAVQYNISGEIDNIVSQNINKDALGMNADALSKISPITQAVIDACNSDANDRKVKLQTLQASQIVLNTIVGNIDVTTRGRVTKVLVGFTDAISSCDVLATGYIGLRDSICGGFSDSIFATYFSLYGCGIFLILFLITTMKIVKKYSRSSAVAPEQAPKVAGAPPEAAATMATTKPGANSKTPQVNAAAKADQKEVKKPH